MLLVSVYFNLNSFPPNQHRNKRILSDKIAVPVGLAREQQTYFRSSLLSLRIEAKTGNTSVVRGLQSV